MQPMEHLDTIAAVAPCCGDVLKGTPPQSHLVQFYGFDDQVINQNVARFLAEGLIFGGALVIGSAARNAAVALKINEIGIDSAMRGVLGPLAGEMDARMEAEPPGSGSAMLNVEARVRWIRQNVPERADEILAQARQFLQPSSVKM